MYPIERQQKIMDILNKEKHVNVDTLSKQLYVGSATIRRDLDMLKKKNLLKRTHGGAIPLAGTNVEIPLSVREHEQVKAKDIIAQIATSLIKSDTLTLDSSSSVIRMIPHMVGVNILSCITNGARTSILLGDVQRKNVHCTGGLLRENSLSFVGLEAQSFVEKYYVDKLFFSCRGISMQKGMTDPFIEEAELRKVMIANSNESYLLCDHTKFDKIYFCNIGNIDMITAVITDQKPDDEWLKYFENLGVKCLYPDD